MVFLEVSFLPERKRDSIIVSPIARAVPAMIPDAKKGSPPAIRVVRVVRKSIVPPDEKPPKNDVMKRIRYELWMPIFWTSCSGEEKFAMMRIAAMIRMRIEKRRICFVGFFIRLYSESN